MGNIERHKRKPFKKSFLKSVQLLLTFNKIELDENLGNEIKQHLVDSSFKITETGELPMIQAQRNTAALTFYEKGLMLSTDKNDYGSFEDFFKIIKNVVVPLLEKAGINILTTSILFKNNSYRVNKATAETEPTKDKILNDLFSPLLLNSELSSYGNIENDSLFTSQYKFINREADIIVELIISAMSLQEQPVDMFLNGLPEINERIYDYWYESVTYKVRNLMEA